MGAGGFSTNYREDSLISRLENSRASLWRRQLAQLNDCAGELARRLAMKLVNDELVETTNQTELESQLAQCLQKLLVAEDFDIQYDIAPVRELVPRPNRVSLYVTAFIIEKLIDHRSIVDIFGTDLEIYNAVDETVESMISSGKREAR